MIICQINDKTMKTNIKDLLKAHVNDSKQAIFKDGSKVSEFLIKEARSLENGYHWFLTEEEIRLFDKSKNFYRKWSIREIEDYLRANFNYEIEGAIVNPDGDELDYVSSYADGLAYVKKYEAFDRYNNRFTPNFYRVIAL